MTVLFLHDWHSLVGGVKPTYLKNAGHEVINPALDDNDFDLAVRTAQSEYDQHQPDVIVGSSRGGAVAMNIDSKNTPLILLCPARQNWGTATTLKPSSMIPLPAASTGMLRYRGNWLPTLADSRADPTID